MKHLIPLLIIAVLLTGCGKFGKKLLGNGDEEASAPPPQPIYTQSGKILSDYMVYGDPEFRKARYVTVEVCTEENTDCQFLPRRTEENLTNKEASYLWRNDGVWITYVPKNLVGMTRWTVQVYA